jgi:hypothetical protein
VQLSALVTTGAPPAEPALRAVLQVRAGGAGAMMGVVILYILVNTWLRFPYISFFIHAWWRWHHLHPQPCIVCLNDALCPPLTSHGASVMLQ